MVFRAWVKYDNAHTNSTASPDEPLSNRRGAVRKGCQRSGADLTRNKRLILLAPKERPPEKEKGDKKTREIKTENNRCD
jgi:hypothetical protein